MKLLLSSLALGFSFISFSQAQESVGAESPAQVQTPAVPTDPDLPSPVDYSDAQSLLTASPFTRSLNLSDSLVLTGIAFIDGKAVATVLNKEKKESYVVSEQPNAQGWRLAETSAAIQLNRTQAKIMIGAEAVTVRYSNEQLSPQKNQTKPGSGGSSDRGRDRDRDRDRSDRRGPDPEMRERMEKLSPEARQQLFDNLRKNGDRMRDASSEDRRAMFMKELERAERPSRSR